MKTLKSATYKKRKKRFLSSVPRKVSLVEGNKTKAHTCLSMITRRVGPAAAGLASAETVHAPAAFRVYGIIEKKNQVLVGGR